MIETLEGSAYKGGNMIEIIDITKKFDQKMAVSQVSLKIKEGTIFGLLGTNGAGKSTILRMLAGIVKPDSGEILYDGKPIWRNPKQQQLIFYQSDESYYFFNATPRVMGEFYNKVYSDFNLSGFLDRLSILNLEPDTRINTFSKGMKKQVSFLLAISSGADYILCDEVFDGLDPMVRDSVCEFIENETKRRKLTFVVASHSLHELDAICHQIGILHMGDLLLYKDVSDHGVDIQELFKRETEEIGYDIKSLIL